MLDQNRIRLYDPTMKTSSKATKTTSEILADQIRNAIISGKFPSGQALKQDVLASQFGVSKIPIREALYLLQNEGLVTFLNNRGSIVSELSINEVDEIYTMRIALEAIALERAIPNLKAADFIAAESSLKLIEASDDPIEWSNLNWIFHSTIYRAAQMPKLLETVSVLHNNVARYLLLYLNTMQQQEHSQQEHWDLLEACRKGRIQQALGLLRQHLEDAKQQTISYMIQQQESE